MFEKLIKYIVYILSILIIIALGALIYGIFKKTSLNSFNHEENIFEFSLNLNSNQKIESLEVIDSNNLLIIIDTENHLEGVIYNLRSKKVIQKISK
ncbi:MAG: hypothetical protein CMI96_03480 [Pelagibacteraceae bacterium]|nr:hypothetical protein [Pelagibacteraceae bacterium]|tara:strand:- start:9432 stop:9719 length:288 start_codon:yes stop_codon:yes gene_type:complete